MTVEQFAFSAASALGQSTVAEDPAPDVNLLVGDLRTGRIVTALPADAGSVEAVLNGAGTIKATVHLDTEDAARLDLRYTAAVARSFLAYEVATGDGVSAIVNAGPIWRHSYSWASRRLTIDAAGLWSLWDHRLVLPALAATNPATEVLSYSGLSLATIAKRLVQEAIAAAGGNLPVVLPADEAGTSERTYRGFELATVADRLGQLVGVQGGPDIRFRARRRADDPQYLEWVMETGTAAAPALVQAGADHVFDTTLPSGVVEDVATTVEASRMASRAYVQGSGMDTSMLIGRADRTDLVDAGYPLLEAVETRSSVVDPATLAGHAQSYVDREHLPYQTLAVTVRRDSRPRLGSYLEGDRAQVLLDGDPYHDLPGRGAAIATRIVGIQADLGQSVTITCADTGIDV